MLLGILNQGAFMTEYDYIDEIISSIIISIGIPTNLSGSAYLAYAVKLGINSPNLTNSIRKNLFPQVANSFGTKTEAVERAIRHAIDVAWCRGGFENLNKIFRVMIYSKFDKPTNTEIITLLINRIPFLMNKEEPIDFFESNPV